MVTQGSASSSAEGTTATAISSCRYPPRQASRNQGNSSSASDIMPRHIVHVLSDDTEFDTIYLQHLHEEGFNVFYETFTGDVKNFNWTIRHLSDDLERGQKYAIIAFGEAATHALSAAQQTSLPHCVSLICYYPTAVPAPTHKYPASLDILCHLAAIQPFGAATFKTHVYSDVYPGFAESDLQEYDKFAAGLSWGRTLACLRRAFGMVVDLERVVDEYNTCKFVDSHHNLIFHSKETTETEYTDKFGAVTSTSIPNQVHYGNHVPTMTGGVGREELGRFYDNVFKPNNPPSMKRRLLSRTVGADKVVDELIISFRHTQEMPW
jgi:hypothetical protein